MDGAAPSTALDLLRLAVEGTRRTLQGHNLRLSPVGRIHALGEIAWLGGLEAPSPLCHVGTARGPVLGLIPTDHQVDCGRCLIAMGTTEAVVPIPDQEPLAGLAELELELELRRGWE